LGIIRIVNANMAKGISGNSVEKGYDLREFALVTMGGAAALHAAALARELNMARVIVPPMCGNFSALGLAVADIQHDYVRTFAKKQGAIVPEEFLAVFKEMEQEGLKQLVDEHVRKERVEIFWSADLRYEGQSWELNTPIDPVDSLDTKTIEKVAADFHQLHHQVYSFSEPKGVVEFVNLRVRVVGKNPPLSLPREAKSRDPAPPHIKEKRPVYFTTGGWKKIPIYERDDLSVGIRIGGPAIVEEQISTTLIPTGHVAFVDEYRNLVIELRAKSRRRSLPPRMKRG
jgi:N-methylhydantoinase A